MDLKSHSLLKVLALMSTSYGMSEKLLNLSESHLLISNLELNKTYSQS